MSEGKKVYHAGKWISASWYYRLRKKGQPNFERLLRSDSDDEISENKTNQAPPENEPLPEHSAVNEQIQSDVNEVSYDERVEEPATVENATFLKPALIDWSLCNNLTMASVTQLLHLLKTFPTIDTTILPRDCRTLYKTPRSIKAKKMDDGFFYFFGIKRWLSQTKNREYIHKNVTNGLIEISFNSDGLNLYKSCKLTCWPVLCMLLTVPDVVIFVSQIYVGPNKPTCCDAHFKLFVEECNDLIANGIDINNSHYDFQVKYVVFDLPAKSFALNIAGHNGKQPCLRCNVKGETMLRRKSFFVPEKK